MKAWIIKWSWVGEHAAVDKPLINILSARVSEDEVRKYIERYYAGSVYSAAEQIAMAKYNKPSEPPYPARCDTIDGFPYGARISCGHNPYIDAFRADGVEAEDTALGVTWDEESVQVARARFREAVARFSR